MVVQSSEFAQAPGAVPASQAGMGQGAPAGMPMVPEQSVPSNGQEINQGAAPPASAPPIDMETIAPEIRTYLESQFRQGYVPEEDLRSFQSRKDKEIADAVRNADLAQTQYQMAQAQVQAANNAFNAYLQGIINKTREPHPNDAAVFQLELNKAAGTVQMSKSQAAMQHRQWEENHKNGFEARIDREAQGEGGLAPLDRGVIANDPEVQRLNGELMATAQADARDLYRNPAHAQRALAIQNQLESRVQYIAQLERVKAAGPQVTPEQALVQNNLDRQQQRGVQTQALPGMGGLTGAFDPDAAWRSTVNQVASANGVTPEKAEADAKLYDLIYKTWVTQYDAAGRQ
jgi:hypothetical protein